MTHLAFGQADELPTMTRRVMVADSDPRQLRALCKMLRENGYDVLGVGSAEEALQGLREGDFDVLMSDSLLPDMYGVDLLRAAVAIDAQLVMILLVDAGSPWTDPKAMEAGELVCLVRPSREAALLPVLNRALEVRQLRLENFRLKESVAIYELSNQIAFSPDVSPILDKVSDVALRQTRADEVSIMLLTPEGDALYVAVARGANRETILGRRMSLDRGVAGWVARHRQMLVLRGEVTDKCFKPIRPRADIRSAVSLPMLSAGALVGVLNVNATRGLRSFTPGQINALTVLANIAASVIRTASSYAQVHEAEEKYRSIFENSIEGIYQTTRDGRFLAANPALAHMYGYETPAELVRSVSDVSTEMYVDPKRREELVERLDDGQSVIGFESQVRCKDGRLIWISESARAVVTHAEAGVYYEGTVHDITLRKVAEMERDRSEAALRESNQDGKVTIQTAVGEGTTVSIRLPVETQQLETQSATGASDVAISPRHVLVVEDEEPLRRVLREYLALAGHVVETAVSGRDGVEKFVAGTGEAGAPARFDLVVTDLAMPDMSGDQLALAVKQIAPSTPIILLTGLGAMMLASGQRPEGVDLIVSKPVSYATLQQAVAKVAAN
jgi:PAS domain S-box-containing protein